MNPFQLIAENKIREAMENGEFDNLPGQGKPIDFSEDEHIPPEYRLAFRIIKNSSNAASESEIIKQIRALKEEAKEIGAGSRSESIAKMIRRKEAELLARNYRAQNPKTPKTNE